MTQRGRFTSLLILFFVFSLDLSGQVHAINEAWRWVQYTTQSGLPSNRVLQIWEAPSGIVWAATQSGLAWYNGYYWQLIDQKLGLPPRLISSITGCGDDSVFVAIDSRLYLGNIKGFAPIPLMENGHEHLIKSFAPFSQNSFLALSDSTLYVLHNNTYSPYRWPSNMSKTRVLSVWYTKGGFTWVNTLAGLYRWENNSWKLKLKSGSLPIYLQYISENKQGYGITMVTSPLNMFGIWSWDEKGNMTHLKSEGMDNLIAYDIASNNNAILIKESGDIRIREQGIWHTVVSGPEQLQMVIFVRYGRDDNLWLGTEKGLYLNKITSKRWTNWRLAFPDPRNSINALLPRKDGSVWLATGGGLVIHYPDGHTETTASILSTKLSPLTGLEEDGDGNVWVSSGSAFDGAFCWNGTLWKHFGYREGLDAGTVHKIRKDHHGRLWFLGLLRPDFETRHVDREPGAYVYEKGKFTSWGPREGLHGGRVLAFAEGSNDTLWFGTNFGLSRWTPDGKWKYWTTENGLRYERIFTIAIDRNGIAWLSDQTSGLGYIKDDSVQYLTSVDGLISNTIWDIQIDNEDKVWIATHSGVSVYNNGVWSKFDGKDGMENVRIWPIVFQHNAVYFGSNGGGVEILNLDAIRKEPPVILTSSPILKGNSVSIESKAYAYWNEQESEDIYLRYRVDSTDWSAWTTRRVITQGDLTPGDHTIEFQTMGMLGKFGPVVRLNSFLVEPPFYRQLKFLLPVGFLSVAVLTIAIVYLRKKRNQDKALRISELRYRNLFESTSDPIIIYEPVTKTILEVNKKALEIYRYRRDDLVGRTVDILSKDFNNEQQYIRQVRSDQSVKTYESLHVKKDGDEIQVRVNLSLVEYDGKSVILSINRDISTQLQAEAKIRLLAQTIASAQDYVSITDLDDNILFVNDAFTKAYGYTNDEICGKNVSILHSLLTPHEIFEKVYSTTLTAGWNGELYNRRKNGTEFLVELWTSPVCNEDGKPVALVGVARDITERKRAEKEREDLIHNLKEAIAEVKTLSGLLPICSSCKKIRDDRGYWTQVETYIAKYSDATFTHGLCPDCLKEYFPEVYERMKNKHTKE